MCRSINYADRKAEGNGYMVAAALSELPDIMSAFGAGEGAMEKRT